MRDALVAVGGFEGPLLQPALQVARRPREPGASWHQITKATGTTAEQARAAYLAQIEKSERYGSPLYRHRALPGCPRPGHAEPLRRLTWTAPPVRCGRCAGWERCLMRRLAKTEHDLRHTR